MEKELCLEALYKNILECDEEFNNFINAKCTQAISSNKTYVNKEASGSIDEDELSIMREKICFVEGVRTGINLLLTIQNYSKVL